MDEPLKIRIYYEDTDAGGVVYYANYLKYTERARTEFFARRGISVAGYHAEGRYFVVAGVEINYHRPARLGDIIEVHSRPLELRGARMSFRHEITREDQLLAEATVRLACTDPSGKPRRFPFDLGESLTCSSPD